MSLRTPAEVGALVRRRREALGLTQEGIPNVSSSLVRSIERGTASLQGRGLTRAALMEALEWPPDGLQRLSNGAEPEELAQRGDVVVEDDERPEEGGPPSWGEIVGLLAELRDEVRRLADQLEGRGSV